MKDHMTAKIDGKTYVASHSLDKRLRRTELMLIATTGMMALMILTLLYIAWRIDHNNLLDQIKTGLEACRVQGWV